MITSPMQKGSTRKPQSIEAERKTIEQLVAAEWLQAMQTYGCSDPVRRACASALLAILSTAGCEGPSRHTESPDEFDQDQDDKGKDTVSVLANVDDYYLSFAFHYCYALGRNPQLSELVSLESDQQRSSRDSAGQSADRIRQRVSTCRWPVCLSVCLPDRSPVASYMVLWAIDRWLDCPLQ